MRWGMSERVEFPSQCCRQVPSLFRSLRLAAAPFHLIYSLRFHHQNRRAMSTTTVPTTSATPPPPTAATTTPPPQNPLRAQFRSRQAVLDSITNNKRALTLIERAEIDIQKQLEDKRYEKNLNLRLWERARVDRGRDESSK